MSLGSFWGPFGFPLGSLGLPLGSFGRLLASLGILWDHFGPPEGYLEGLWWFFWVSLGSFGLPFGILGARLMYVCDFLAVFVHPMAGNHRKVQKNRHNVNPR